jgi:hypothetical protein
LKSLVACFEPFAFSRHPMFMDRDREKQALEEKLARCRDLASEFREGPTAEMIRILEAELREQIRRLDKE